jgi:hypothetical protein
LLQIAAIYSFSIKPEENMDYHPLLSSSTTIAAVLSLHDNVMYLTSAHQTTDLPEILL